jgi:hypothetical protein
MIKWPRRAGRNQRSNFCAKLAERWNIVAPRKGEILATKSCHTSARVLELSTWQLKDGTAALVHRISLKEQSVSLAGVATIRARSDDIDLSRSRSGNKMR